MLTAVIFDFDGIIVDTEPLHYRAFQEVLAPLGLGYSWDVYLERYLGFDDRDALREAFRCGGRALREEDLHRLITEKGEAFTRIIASGVSPYPGVIELIRSLKGCVPLAICSGALPSDIAPILKQFGISGHFDVMVTAADVRASKPDPASYALAVARLQENYPDRGIVPSNCLAIEDTPAGIASARGAGLKVVAVTNSYPEAELSGALKIIATLDGVDLQCLEMLL
ncbi:MAG TPA: HAD family phosphatase [Geobacteraceae bacterium]|nr:HAD family phosphatase [Geobacteraceae bacterium]